MAKDYTSTLNLPKTDFSMRANLPQREPEMLKAFDAMGLYQKMLERNEGKPTFLLHDGPPFSNGNIHMGTALNKILKDFINKYKSMTGYRVPFIPGWDNHGMPIESAIIKQNKIDRKKMPISKFRSECEKFAMKYVDLQRTSFKRLGVTADWENPYLTMTPDFEAREVRVFGEMFNKGYIYKGLKPVYWCPKDETALAEAEIEYKEDPCTSIFVKFLVNDDKGLLDGVCDKNNTYFIIWTTTPWTLPGNQAIAVHPGENYSVIKAENGECYVTADVLASSTMKAGGIANYEIIKTFKGKDLEYMTARHPFLDRDSLVANALYVTMDSGTGCVHTAGGFGADDYVTSRNYNIDVIVPVDDRGYQTEDAGKFAGMFYEESNEAILNDMKETGALFASEKIVHSYPHCWRCKNPIIFRATPQWFCSVDAFKDEAVKACEEVEWLPNWGGDRIKQMIKERADWCISRQRHWGLPIPVFYCADCGKIVCNKDTIESVAEAFLKHGSNSWFDFDPRDLLPENYACPHCGGSNFTKETDTLDGWFDSGSSHFSVIEDVEGQKWPADLYLEGADQYRGWFQSSLLTAVGAKGQGAPYRQVLTHGWVVDGEGKAMHKSLGNSIYPEDMIKKYGADLVRLWAASAEYRVDVRVSDAIFKQLSEAYRKIRNTARIMMANLDGFNPDTDMVPAEKLNDIDKWALARLNKLIKTVTEAYDNYEFHVLTHEIVNFCTIDMSKLYIDITKDTLYVEKKESEVRRSTQTAVYHILSSLTKMIAPILAYTSNEIWQAMPHAASDNREHVLLNDMQKPCDEWSFSEVEEHYNKLFDLRDDILKALEIARANKLIGKSLDAKVTVYTEDEGKAELLRSFGDAISTILIVSETEIVNGAAPEGAYTEGEGGLGVVVTVAEGCKCDRCWMHTKNGKETEDGGFICYRCDLIVNG